MTLNTWSCRQKNIEWPLISSMTRQFSKDLGVINKKTERECENRGGHALWKYGVVRIRIRVPQGSTERLDYPTIDAWLEL